MTARSERKRNWMILAAAGGLVLGYAYFFFLPASRQITEMKSQLDLAEAQAAGAVQTVAAIGVTEKQLSTASEYVDRWQRAAPSEDQLSEVFERIHELMRLAGTRTTRFEPQRAIAFETFLRIPLSMECEGSFAQLAAVLTGLENMREPIWLRSLEIQSTGQDSELVKAEISLDVFADNLEDSDQENLPGEPITLEADRISQRLSRSGTNW
jgi:Tfp pilus assembly protein PilO